MSKSFNKISFEGFLLNEANAYLGQKIGSILNALQDLSDNAKAMGTRHLVKSAEEIVNQIRQNLRIRWPQEEERTLKELQKVAVAIMKAIEDKDDLDSILQSSNQVLHKLLGKMDVPLNQLATPPDQTAQDNAGSDETSPKQAPPKQTQQPTQPPEVTGTTTPGGGPGNLPG